MRHLLACFASFTLMLAALGAQAPVLTQRNDTKRTAAYVQQGFGPQVFAPQNHWGLLGILPVDGVVYAQPLYLPGLPIGGGTRNVLVVATARNHVFAFDADTLHLIWENRTLPPPDTSDDEDPVKTHGSGSRGMSPTYIDVDGDRGEHGIGIQSTPVIDPSTARMYFAYRTHDSVKNLLQHVAALDLHDGKIVLAHTLTSGDLGDVGGNAITGLRQRSSLLLSQGVLYVAFAGHVEDPDVFGRFPAYRFRGQVLAFDPSSLRTLGRFQTVPDDKFGGGIWMGSTGIAEDSDGSIYFTTGNIMSLSQTQNKGDAVVAQELSPECRAGSTHACRAVGDAAVRLMPSVIRDSAGIPVKVSFPTRADNPPGVFDFFMPYRAIWHNFGDFDLGSSGVLLVPGTRELVIAGKEGILYVINRDPMNGYDTKHWSLSDYRAACPTKTTVCGEANRCPYVPDDPLRDPGTQQKIRVGIARTCSDPPMDNWLPWAHVHGTPAYSDFANGRSFLYVWPEKGNLQAYERDRTASSLRFRTGAARSIASAPDSGMPGGFVSIAVDPLGTGVVFASVPSDNAVLKDGTDALSGPRRLRWSSGGAAEETVWKRGLFRTASTPLEQRRSSGGNCLETGAEQG